jgi:hypothetical protein
LPIFEAILTSAGTWIESGFPRDLEGPLFFGESMAVSTIICERCSKSLMYLLDEAGRYDVNTNPKLFAQREHVFGRRCGGFQPLNRQCSSVSAGSPPVDAYYRIRIGLHDRSSNDRKEIWVIVVQSLFRVKSSEYRPLFGTI